MISALELSYKPNGSDSQTVRQSDSINGLKVDTVPTLSTLFLISSETSLIIAPC
jgi:hypothetical protein